MGARFRPGAHSERNFHHKATMRSGENWSDPLSAGVVVGVVVSATVLISSFHLYAFFFVLLRIIFSFRFVSFHVISLI